MMITYGVTVNADTIMNEIVLVIQELLHITYHRKLEWVMSLPLVCP